MTVIFIIILILFLFLLRWMWLSLGSIEKTTKITCIVYGLVILYIVTLIIYNISKIGITYNNQETMKIIQTVFVMLFTIINSYIILPYTFKKLEQINNDEIEKEKIIKSVIIVLIVVIVLAVFEISYLGSIQSGILHMIDK